MNISIVMTTYNGGRYVIDQLSSIYPYLEKGDEIIISDDGSKDNTLQLIYSYISNKPNVKVISGPQQGVVKNFEYALSFACKDIIMFADQDDIWLPSKISAIREKFNSNEDVELVMHDMFLATNEEINHDNYCQRSFCIRKRRHGVLYNLFYNGYYGCCMCFTQNFKKVILPFSKYTNMYDEWIGLVAEHRRKVLFYDEALIVHRVHNNNMGQNLTVFQKIKSRFTLLKSYLDYLYNKKNNFFDNFICVER